MPNPTQTLDKALRDIESALDKAFTAIKTIESTCACNAPAPVIRRVIDKGELSFRTTHELLESAGRALDKACSYDICGNVVFEGEDGDLYTLVVEAEIVKFANQRRCRSCGSDDLATSDQQTICNECDAVVVLPAR